MGFDLSQYQTVAERLALWLDDCKQRGVQSRVVTDMMHRTENQCTFRADLYEDGNHIASGWAEEHATDRGVNSTSHVENCETSAVGRALANAGWAGSDPAKRASREEMAKVARRNPITGAPPSVPTEKMLNFLTALEKRTGEVTLEAARTDFDVCRQEIDRLQNL